MKTVERSRSEPTRGSSVELALTLVLGLLIGLCSLGFLSALRWIEQQHTVLNSGYPYHLLLLVPVFFILDFLKKRTLYFPAKVYELRDERSADFWSRWMTTLHWGGNLFSHFAGASVGREEAALLYSSGLVRLFGLSWSFWGPILMSTGFACLLGSPWVAPVFMFEFFGGRTSWKQKIYSFIATYAAVLVLQSFQIHHLFENAELHFEAGFFAKAVVLFFMALVFGLLMRLYKSTYVKVLNLFHRQPKVRWLAVILLMLFLAVPELRKFQGIGLAQFSDLGILVPSYIDALGKLVITLLSNALGFLGGEFTPFIYAGTHLGAALFLSFGLNTAAGAAFGAYLLFAGATRMKWTSYVLFISAFGFEAVFWGYFVIVLTSGFSGALSLYEMQPVTSDTEIL